MNPYAVRVSAPAVILLCFVASAVAGIRQAGLAAGAPGQRDFRFGIKVEMVTVFATVHDRRGKIVTGLGPDDFVVYDNDIPQPISQFSREYVPLSIVVLIDASASMAGKKLDTAKKSLVQFLRHLRRGDEAGLIAFDSRAVVLQDFTSDLDRVAETVRKLRGLGSTALYDAILSGLTKAEEARNRRQVLLLLSDGINTFGNAELNETIARLRRSAAELFAIGLEPERQDAAMYESSSRPILDRLTGSAGGAAFVVSQTKELGNVCRQIADRIHSQYTLAYYPPPAADGRWRTVRIAARRPGLQVISSKTGYFPGSDDSNLLIHRNISPF
jgi:VWFA-related protein